MSLAAVLSAVRQLLLDDIELPDGENVDVISTRASLYRSKFSGLTEEELEDLAKIPPERIRIYTQTVFAGERNNLRNHFPMTFALLRRAWGDNFDSFQLMRDLHAARPWKSYKTADLAINFCNYLVEDREDLRLSLPELRSVTELERLSLKVSRGADADRINAQMIDLSSVSALSVAELMEFSCVRAPCSQLSAVSHDVLWLRDYFYENDREVPEQTTPKRDAFIAGGRSRWGGVRWCYVSVGLHDALKGFGRGERFYVGSLAEAFLNGRRQEDDSEQDDSKLFLEFFTSFQLLAEGGVLLTDASS